MSLASPSSDSFSIDAPQDWSYQDLRDRRRALSDVGASELLVSETRAKLEKIKHSGIGLRSVMTRIGSFFKRDAFLNADDAAQKKDDLRRELEGREAAYEEAKQRLAELDQRLYGPFPVTNPRFHLETQAPLSVSPRPIARPILQQASDNVIHPNMAAWQRHLAKLSEEKLDSVPPHLKEVLEGARERARRAVENQRAKVGASRSHLKIVSTPAAPSPVPPEYVARNNLSSISPEQLEAFKQKTPVAAQDVLTGIRRARHEMGFDPSLHSKFLELQEDFKNLKMEARLLNEQKATLEKRIVSRGSLSKLWLRFTQDRIEEELNDINVRLDDNENKQQLNFSRRMEIKSHFDKIAA